MSTPQLPSLWPVMFRHARALTRPTTNAATATTRCRSRAPRNPNFSSASCQAQQQTSSQRYGTANEPPAHLGGGRSVRHRDATKVPSPAEQYLEVKGSSRPTTTGQADEDVKTKGDASPSISSEDASQKAETTTSVAVTAQPPAILSPPPSLDSDNALSKILQMEPPMSDNASSEDKPPHLQASQYTHHFDTHTLVRNLKDQGGWSEEQAIDIMKSVRGILGANMELARDGLVSKGDAEMESYLFRAACSELRTESRQRRQMKAQEMSTSRTNLQHEVEILSQKISQDLMTLKDELKGMFDDRKMSARGERREMENKIQELNYKITIALNSEMRSEVEGLRWVMTRRTVIALAIIVLMSLMTLRYAKYMEHKQALERKLLEESGNHGKKESSRDNRDPNLSNSSERAEGNLDFNSEEVRRRIESGENPSLVTLG